MEAVFHASIKLRAYLVVPLLMTDVLSQSNVWPVVRQCRTSSECSSCRLTVPLCSFTRVENSPLWMFISAGKRNCTSVVRPSQKKLTAAGILLKPSKDRSKENEKKDSKALKLLCS